MQNMNKGGNKHNVLVLSVFSDTGTSRNLHVGFFNTLMAALECSSIAFPCRVGFNGFSSMDLKWL